MLSAKAAPKFLLAEGEGKWLSLPTVPPETVPTHGGEEAARRELPRAAAGQDYSPGWDVDLPPVPSEQPHHPADSDSEMSLLCSPAGFFLPCIRNWIMTIYFKGLN